MNTRVPRDPQRDAPDGGTTVLNRDVMQKLTDVTYLWQLVVRWKWWFLAPVALSIVLAIVATLLATPRYSATVRLEISREDDSMVSVDQRPQAMMVDQEFYKTQYGLLESRELARRVAADLRLQDNESFFAMAGLTLEQAGRRADGAALSVGQAREARQYTAADILLRRLAIDPVEQSRLVDVTYSSPDRALAQRVANAWASNFVKMNLARKYESTSYARRFLETRLNELRQRLEQSERELVRYASQERIINLPSSGENGNAGSGERRTVIGDNLVALNAALAEARAARIEAQSRLGSSAGGASREALANSAISELRQRRAEAAADYAKLLVQFEPGYPAARALESQIAQLDRAIAREEGRVSSSLRNNYDDATRREEALQTQVEQSQNRLLDLRRRSIQYNIIQREVDTNRSLYDGLLQRYKEIGVSGGVGTNNVSVVDPAELPGRPSYPRPVVNLFVALVIGLFLGSIAAFVRDQFDDAITDPTQVSEAVGLPNLGIIPKLDGSPVEALSDPKSPLTDAYLSLDTNLQYSSSMGMPRALSVTSTRPAEGKSTTSLAIARTLSRLGKRVLLIDGDMRSPSMGHLLGVPNDIGLSDYLTNTLDLDRLVRLSGFENLSVMTAGRTPPNAAELLSGSGLERLLDELGDAFDHIVIDCPPVLGLADAPLIASKVDGTLFAIESHGTRLGAVRVALARLRDTNAHVLGTVLVKFDVRKQVYGYGYDYGYGYGESKRGNEAA